ncbi:MAG TPA: serine hydrolase domain-containing protein [Streptosporangiaceae bacterium]|nr:serine hydrolase domain-containing protein [Streptosporangiaceae bacterium]
MSEQGRPVAAGADEYAAKLAAFVKDNRLYGAAASVVHGDELAWAGGAGFADLGTQRPAGPDTLYRIASITKTFTGTAILQLRDAGKLDLDDPAEAWLPELDAAGPGIGHITIRRLLSHESGLTSEPPETDWASLEPVYEGSAAANLARAAEIRAAIGPSLQPKYSNLGYQLLGEIVARAGGTAYPDYVRREILDPLGLADTVFDPLGDAHRDRGATGYGGRSFSDELELAPEMTGCWAEGGLWSSAADLAKWVCFQLRAHADRPADSPLLAATTLREMHKPRYLSDETWTKAWCISWYAVRRDDVTWIQHSGGLHGFTSNACFDRDQKVGVVVLLNGIADAPALAMEIGAVARRIAAASAPALAPPPPMPGHYEPLLGLYAFPRMDGLGRVEWRDGELVMVLSDVPDQVMPLRPDADADTFTVGPGFRDSGESVRFRRLPDGRVASVFFGSATMLRLAAVGGS